MRVKDSIAIILFLFSIIAAFILIDSNRFADPDLFCHLYSGREIVQEGRVPHSDTHSFSVKGGKWIDYEWGARALFYILYDRTGSSGLVLLRAFLSILVFALIFLGSMRITGSAILSSLSVVLSAAASYRYLLFRPQLFTFLFIALLIFLLIEYKNGKKKLLFFVPCIFLLWTNLHAGFPLGLAVFVLFIVSELFVSYRIEGLPGRVSMNLFLIGIFFISFLLTIVNPYGFDLWKGILGTIFGSFTPELSEWKPAYEFPFLRLFWFYAFFAIFIIFFLMGKKKDLFDLILFFFLAYLSITKVRFIPLFSISLAPFLARQMKGMLERFSFSFKALPVRVLVLILVLLPLIVKGVQGEIHTSMKIYKTDFYQPVAAVKIMKENGLAGNVMNDYDWGGYIRWELTGCRIFVDGRSDTVYPKKTIDEWTFFVQGKQGWEDILKKYDADAILIRSQQPVNEVLKRSNRWKAVYYDDICSLYMNIESSRNAAFLKRWLNDSLIINATTAQDYFLQ